MAVYRRWIPAAVACATIGGCGADRDETAVGTPTVAVEAPEAQMEDAEYLYRLGLMRGHLLVGHALFKLGERMAARTHSKHPTDEIYAPMKNEFSGRGSAGFAAQLEAHADAVANADADTVAVRYRELVAAIGENETVVEASAELAADVIVRLVREAAREYAIGIVDGKPANAHEYQDAYGFTQTARQWSKRMGEEASAANKPVFDRIGETLEALDGMWPALMPPSTVSHQASRLDGAAADIEILALGLR